VRSAPTIHYSLFTIHYLYAMPATTIAEVIAQLDNIVQQSIQQNDRCGYFAALYKKVTVAVAEKIQAGDFFADNARMERLDVVFANRYLLAYQQYKAGQPCSAAWQVAFAATKSWKPMVIDHLMLGMNAHIGLDLGIAAATVAPGNQISGLQGDFDKINIVLNSLVNGVKDSVFAIWPVGKWMTNWIGGETEDAIAGFSMTIARDRAWRTALEYAPLTDATAQVAYITARDNKVAAFGKKLLHPGAFLTATMYVLRLFELGTVASKIQRLNGVVGG
jgi:hypothetical protein